MSVCVCVCVCVFVDVCEYSWMCASPNHVQIARIVLGDDQAPRENLHRRSGRDLEPKVDQAFHCVHELDKGGRAERNVPVIASSASAILHVQRKSSEKRR